ncbi:aspartate/glutamate racemase family protein (plasmid) [Variovorax sp. V213]|uniref:aspartate/glutamate racemase family protein n=1 Tax=Variovorax sp. V213 TaxID=3065955 RepID=UPI0034E84F74
MTAAAPGFLGVLMLDTRFPRPPGDVGNPDTYARAGIPVRFLTVEGASPRRIVEEADPRLIQPFVDAAVRLVADGASMITTSCGFLAAYQDELSKAVPVPVLTSSLLQVRRHANPGIVTFDAASLTPQILQAAGVPAGTPLAGVRPGCEFHRRILNNDTVLDLAEAQRNVIDAAVRLIEASPAVENIVLECTNMPPYRESVAAAVGRQVHDIETLILEAWYAGNAAQHPRR